MPEAEFAALIETLGKREGWQAMFMRDGLALRRERPEVAKAFDEWLREVPNSLTKDKIGFWYFHTNFPRDPDSNTLGFEAGLTSVLYAADEAAMRKLFDDDYRNDPEFIELANRLRLGLMAGDGRHPENAQRKMALLEDRPDWLPIERASQGFHGLANGSPGSLDKYIPRLVEFYREYRSDVETHQIARNFLLGIVYASPKVARPALEEIRQFELQRMPEQGYEPWKIDLDALLHNTRQALDASIMAVREGREPEVVQQLRDAHKQALQQLPDPRTQSVVLLWNRINEAIDKIDAEAAREPGD